ncbi:MAG: nucleoside permease [Chitinophagales bacterium]|nr:nucleoside permease [Chitinophagales bacterium]
MGLKFRLTILNFLEFFVWGAWLITIANYWFGTKQWDGSQFGLIFSTMGISSLFMPTLTGIIADRWINAEKLFGLLHIFYGITLIYLTKVGDPNTFFWVMLVAMCCYMPTIALNNSISYNVLKSNGFDVVKDFPPIRVYGTIGFIAAMWLTNLTGNKATIYQFYIGGFSAIALGLFSFSLPACPPAKNISKDANWAELMGLNAFKLFKNFKIALFLIFSMFLGAALQLTNMYGDVFLDDFKFFPKYADSIIVQRSTLIMSISQISETVFILTIPFFLKRFGIKTVMLFSMFAWVLRFALFGLGDPGAGLWMIILSCIVYGFAFDFFNISGSLFIETSTIPAIRSSAQGLFMMMTNGVGAIFGSYTSGKLIDKYFTQSFTDIQSLATYLHTETNNSHLLKFLSDKNIQVDAQGLFDSSIALKNWSEIWFTFAAYSIVVAILFAVLFKHKHDPNAISKNIGH